MEEHESSCINIVKRFKLGIVDTETVKKTNGVGKPRYVVVQEKRRDDEETGYVVNEE